ncbi:hypothetical protein FOA52_008687 [Chlamydomonas sp. UWO 241]|nr:hypothetical protein FOA52_008687 [Chlamydomonas sp. UWO 241]
MAVAMMTTVVLLFVVGVFDSTPHGVVHASMQGGAVPASTAPQSLQQSGQQQQQQAASTGQAAAVGPGLVELTKLRAYAAALDEELIANAAPGATYVGGSKGQEMRNPCWRDPTSKALSCVPGAYIMGTFHAGATSLAAKLSRHPQVLLDQMSHSQFWAEDGKKMADFVDGFSAAAKEIDDGAKSKLILEVSQSTLAFYLASGAKAHRHFSAVIGPCFRNCSENSAAHSHTQDGEENIDMETCMGTMCYPAAREADMKVATDHGYDYVRDQNNPTLMRAVYGNTLPRLVVVLRNPVARIHSAFFGYPHYYEKHGRHQAGFLAYVKEQVAGFRACEAGGHSSDECALLFETFGPTQEKVYFHCDQLLRGMYTVWMEGWLRAFPREVIHVVHAEDLFTKTQDTVNGIIAFLGLEPFDTAGWEAAKFAGPTRSYAADQAMLPEANQILADFYRPFNDRLAALLEDERVKEWNTRKAPASMRTRLS